jgi:hypothetical protein
MDKFTTELRRPLRDGLKRDVNAALGQQVFDVTQAQRNSIIEPYRVSDNFGWKDDGVCNE